MTSIAKLKILTEINIEFAYLQTNLLTDQASMMETINLFQRRWLMATILHQMPVFGFLLWLICYEHNVFTYALFALVIASLLLKKSDIWFRWILPYVICNCGAFIYFVWCALNIVVSQVGTTKVIFAGIIAVLGAVMLLLNIISSVDLAFFLGRRKFPVRDALLAQAAPKQWPSVCFQVPTYDEPPEMVIETIRKLLLQDYPGRWMIQVIDNNTPHPSTWHPVRDFCAKFSGRIEFMHLENWPGYKSGALNEGIRRLPDWVDHIAIVDADYHVDPDFLRTVVPHFSDSSVAFVQTPQSYRDWQESRFLQSLYYNYEEYFQTRKPARAEINGIICVGTMAVIRRTAIQEVGLWDEASCTEDAELSVRLLGRGWKGVFDHRPKGYGLMPFDFNGMRKQRFRWAFGMMHIFRKHRKVLFGLPFENKRLTFVQRLSFLGLANQFLMELVPLLSTVCFVGILGLTAITGYTEQTLPLILMPAIAFSLYIWGAVMRILLATRHVTMLFPIVGSIVVAFAISWTIAWACICGVVSHKVVFLRTPKTVNNESWWNALRAARVEIIFALANVLLGIWAYQQSLVTIAVLTGLLALIFCSAPIIAVVYALHYSEVDTGAEADEETYTNILPPNHETLFDVSKIN